MNRDLVWPLLVGALLLVVVVLYVVDHIQQVNERDAVFGGGICEQSAMVEAVRSYRTSLLAAALGLPVFGVLVAAAMARRLRPELYTGRNGTWRRLLLGLLVAVGTVLVMAFLLFFLGGQCFRAAVGEEGGLPPATAAGIGSLVGGLVPNFWLASSLETLLVTVLSFFVFSLASRQLSKLALRLRRA